MSRCIFFLFSFFSWFTTLATAGSALVGDRKIAVSQVFADDRGKDFVDESSLAILGGVGILVFVRGSSGYV